MGFAIRVEHIETGKVYKSDPITQYTREHVDEMVQKATTNKDGTLAFTGENGEPTYIPNPILRHSIVTIINVEETKQCG